MELVAKNVLRRNVDAFCINAISLGSLCFLPVHRHLKFSAVFGTTSVLTHKMSSGHKMEAFISAE
jgi:hypothetical protein